MLMHPHFGIMDNGLAEITVEKENNLVCVHASSLLYNVKSGCHVKGTVNFLPSIKKLVSSAGNGCLDRYTRNPVLLLSATVCSFSSVLVKVSDNEKLVTHFKHFTFIKSFMSECGCSHVKSKLLSKNLGNHSRKSL